MAEKRLDEVKKEQITEFVKVVAQLDEQSINQLHFAAEVLLARDRQVQLTLRKNTACEVTA